MKAKYLSRLAGVALTGVLLSGGVAQAALTQCPTVGSATSCAVLYTFNADGSVSTTVDGSISSTDGVEDTLAGVQNNSGHSINSLTLTGVGNSGFPLFSFDGDGQSTVPNPGSGPGATYFGHHFAAGNTLLGTTTFSNISADKITGTINFAGLTNGGYGWFVLEDQINFNAPPVVVGNVPEPASLALLGIGLLGLLATRRRNQAT